MQSKSKDIRSNLSELLCLLFEEWPTKALEKNQIPLRDAVKKGIADADSEARRHSRRFEFFQLTIEIFISQLKIIILGDFGIFAIIFRS